MRPTSFQSRFLQSPNSSVTTSSSPLKVTNGLLFEVVAWMDEGEYALRLADFVCPACGATTKFTS